MKFYVVWFWFEDEQEHSREVYSNKKDAVREAKRLCKSYERDEFRHSPEVYRVTTDGTKREVMQLVKGSMHHGSWEVVWEAESYNGRPLELST